MVYMTFGIIVSLDIYIYMSFILRKFSSLSDESKRLFAFGGLLDKDICDRYSKNNVLIYQSKANLDEKSFW